MPRKSAEGGSSQKKARNAQLDTSDDSQMDCDSNESQATGSSQANSNPYGKMSREEFKRKVADVCRYMLFADNKKVPIKRQDITKNVLKEHSKAFPKIFSEVKKHLSNVFGFDVAEIELGAAKVPCYVLVNHFGPCIDGENQTAEVSQVPNAGLLITVLSLIFMSGGMITEDTLWHALKQLGLEKGKGNFDGEDPDKTICNEFTRRQYVAKKKVAGPEGPTFEFRWGPRAEVEITKRSVLLFVSKMYNTDIESWKMQYKDVLASEQNAA